MKRFIFFLYFSAMVILPHTITAMMPQLSPAEMQQLEQLEKQLMQEIDQYVSSLSPEEQRKFHEAVEEETRKIEQMKPEELNKYIEDTFSAVGETVQQPTIPTKPAEAAKPEKIEEKIIKPEEKEKQANTIELIESLIKQIDSYLLKINSTPELSAKLPTWAQQGRIVGWKADMTFNSFKKEIEMFNQQLHKLKQQDTKTKKYIFLPDVIENEALLNNLAKVNNTLKHWEPQIQVHTHEFKSITEESKKATIQATNILLEGLTILAIPSAIDDVIIKYDPIAKQKREEAEQERKKALELSKQGQRPGTVRSIGVDPSERGGYAPQYGYTDNSSYSPYRKSYGGGYGSNFNKYNANSPSFSKNQTAPQRGKPSAPVSGNRPPAGKGKPTSTTDSKGDQKSAKTLEKDKKDAAKITTTELSEQAKRRINAIADSVERALDRLEKARLTKPLAILSDSQELNIRELQAELNYADRAIQYLEDAIGSINRLATTGSAEQKKLYAKKLNDAMSEHKRTISIIIDQIKQIREKQDSFSDEKRYFYLGGQKADVIKNIDPNKITEKPFNLYQLAQLLQDLESAMRSLSLGQEISKKKSPTPTQK